MRGCTTVGSFTAVRECMVRHLGPKLKECGDWDELVKHAAKLQKKKGSSSRGSSSSSPKSSSSSRGSSSSSANF